VKQTYRTWLSALCCCALLHAELKTLKPGFNFFSRDQDIKLGQEAAAQVVKTQPVIHNREVDAYLAELGKRLQQSPRAGNFPFSYHLIYDKNINAFALPGGPIFINTATILAADNEAQLVGVLAHEMSHVALRHGTHEASKQNLISIPAALAGAVLGGTMLGSLAQLGIGLGTGSVLLKFSRDAEAQADYNGAEMMADAGYNPLEMAHFFEKLESSKQAPQFLSDHPNPGNRVQAIEDELRQMPQRDYNANTGEFPHIKDVVARIPPPGQYKGDAPGSASSPAQTVPDARPAATLTNFDSQSYSLQYPQNWTVFGDKNAGAVTIAPDSGLVRGQDGKTSVGYGMIASYYNADNPSAGLAQDTAQLVRQLQSDNPDMHVTQPASHLQVGGEKALETVLSSHSPYPNEGAEIDRLVTISRPQGLFYIVFVTPQSEYKQAKPIYDNILRSINFR
jgi:Zn-dependent protease with chaperone function